MSDFVKATPKTSGELWENLKKLADNYGHVKNIEVKSNRIEVDLDWSANNIGKTPDFYIPIIAGKLDQARDMIERFKRTHTRPTQTEAEQLFLIVDQSA